MNKTKLLLSFCLGSIITLFVSCKHEPEDILYGLGNTDAIGQNGSGGGPIDSMDLLKLNEIQVIASHNSYRLHTDQDLYDRVQQLYSTGALSAIPNPNGWDYSHLPIKEQLQDYRVRGLEYDIYYDPNGGQFAKRQGRLIVLDFSTASGIAELDNPGFKMLHIPDLDYNSSELTFKGGLMRLKEWSDAHPNHIPVFVNIETKEETPADALSSLTIPGLPFSLGAIGGGLTKAKAFDANAVMALDDEIKSVFGSGLENVFSPDELRGTYSTLPQAVAAGNWPKLKDIRGKVIFIIEGAASDDYLVSSSVLAGKACFVYTDKLTDDYSSFIILNSPKDPPNGKGLEIAEAVSKGFIVRTRSDSDTDEARTGDSSNLDAAIARGAHIISTDYYKADARAGQPGWTDFKVDFKDGANTMFRINPVSAPTKVSLGALKE